jgi:hypothetical protein
MRTYRDTINVNFKGEVYEVYCEITNGEPETREYPGSGPEIEILSITCDKEELIDELKISEIMDIESLILDEL